MVNVVRFQEQGSADEEHLEAICVTYVPVPFLIVERAYRAVENGQTKTELDHPRGVHELEFAAAL